MHARSTTARTRTPSCRSVVALEQLAGDLERDEGIDAGIADLLVIAACIVRVALPLPSLTRGLKACRQRRKRRSRGEARCGIVAEEVKGPRLIAVPRSHRRRRRQNCASRGELFLQEKARGREEGREPRRHDGGAGPARAARRTVYAGQGVWTDAREQI